VIVLLLAYPAIDFIDTLLPHTEREESYSLTIASTPIPIIR